jgi:D-alanine-D-alanine ligase
VDLNEISWAVILHNPVGEGDDPSTSDVLAQVELVAQGLKALGIPHQALAVPDWKPWLHVSADPGTIVFNLMEAPPGVPHVHPAAAAALELLGTSFTGSPAGALWLTTDKLATRALLAAEGLPVAPGGRLDPENAEILDSVPGPWILKPACEDASLGLEGDPVCSTREEALARAKALMERFPGQNVVIETYLTGREINVSMLAGKILPVAEIVFEDFPEGMSRVVGYEAKWQEDSFAYVHTVRRFPEDPSDAVLLKRIGEIAEAAWKVCGLRGYARIDFRLDEHEHPYILEVNANPCLAADAGFMAAAAKAGLPPEDVIGRILEDA